MTLGGFILRNALRNRRRFVLTVSSVAVSLFLLTILQVMLRGFTDPAGTDQSAARLVVRHKVSLANMLFSRYQSRIERLPGVAACTKLVWFGGLYRDEGNFFPQFACDADALFNVMTEARIEPIQRLAFLQERIACVVGEKTMRRFGWNIGDRITLLGAMWPCNPVLTIRGVFAGSIDDTMLFFHHEYFDELLGDRGFTGLFWVRARSAAEVDDLREKIDAAFQNSDAETQTETERAFQVGFVSMLGNIKALIGTISTVIVFTLILVTAATMSMAIRERKPEMAILKALGYDGRRILGLTLAESIGLSLVGGVIGCGAAGLAVGGLDIQTVSRGLFVNFEVTSMILARGMGMALVLGVVSGLPPAWAAIRQGVVEALRFPD
jgi:putative ABC transport system permease protein